MKLLFDANLSRKLPARVEGLFPESAHVSIIGPRPSDTVIWRYAQAHNFVIVTKDSDFYRMSVTWGAPSKVVWLKIGNTSTQAVERHLQAREMDILSFESDPMAALLVVDEG